MNHEWIDKLVFNFKADKDLKLEYRQILLKHHRFYQKLPHQSRDIFNKKMVRFILTKEFVSKGGLPEITDEMVALISATAVQLTFGLPDITLNHFDTIAVFPNNYYSTSNQQYHQGEVSPGQKTIVLSWHHFVAGLANPSDGINLGLHEMAHALKLENIINNQEYDFFIPDEYKKWEELAQKEINKINTSQPTIYRQYAGTNEDEFFAVSVEIYFEQPGKLLHYNPELYKTLSNLLHQDIIQLYE